MKDKIAALREIIAHKQRAKIDGQMVDLFTASAIIAVYDKLSPDNQAKLVSFPLVKMAAICFKLVK